MSGSKTEITKVIGSTIECMVKEKLPGLMADAIRANINMIKNMALEPFSGPMEESMLAIGRMVNSMEEGSTSCLMAIRRLASGLRARKLSGLRKMLPISLEMLSISRQILKCLINFIILY